MVAAENKPLALAGLLQELQGEATIVFTSSVEATRRQGQAPTQGATSCLLSAHIAEDRTLGC